MNTQWTFDVADRAYLTSEIDWDKLHELFPVLEQMKKVNQNPAYHREGNVFNHTKMVVESLVGNMYWRTLEPWNRSALFLSALLHDVGKIDRTQEEGDITSKGHSSSGARMIRRILWDFDGGFKVPFDVREYVATMALLHMLPVYLLDKQDPLYSVVASSHTVCNKDLSILSEADAKGRICDDNGKAIESIELFREFCIENGCYLHPKSFVSDHTRFLYFYDKVGHPDLERYDDCKGDVYIMSGLPGAGKDTYISKNLSNMPSVGLDDIREEMDVKPMEDEGNVAQLTKERCREHMRKKENFVFNSTNFVKATRGRWIRLFRQYGYRIHIIYLEPPFTTLMKQNLGRTKKVPEEIVTNMFRKIEPPTILECHRLVCP